MERGHVIFYDDILLNSLTSLAKFFLYFCKVEIFFVLVSALTFSRNGRVIPFNKK
jgi:hypothetical protein